MNTTALRWIGLALALVAAYLSNSLLSMHAAGKSDLGLLAGICGKDGEGCNKVVASRWGVFPPAPADETADPIPPPNGAATGNADGTTAGAGAGEASARAPSRSGIPVAALGLFYYILLAVYLGLIGRPSWPVRKLHKVILGVNAVGILGSLIYICIMLFAIGDSCILCFGTHLCNFILFPILWKIRPDEPKFPVEGGGLVKPVLPFPDTRLAATSLLLVFALCYGQWNSYRALSGGLEGGQVAELEASLKTMNAELESMATLRSDYGSLKDQIAALAKLEFDNEELRAKLEKVNEFAEDVEKIDAAWIGQEKLELGIRPDDARIEVELNSAGRTGRKMQLTVFSDLECPNCAKFHDFLLAELLPLFKGHLEVVFKHYPGSIHPNALPAAKALEAARQQGGNEKFWAMHEYLHARWENLAAVDYTQAAIAIGLDPTRFTSDMSSSVTTQRLNGDMMKAFKDLGIKGTPAVFLNGRPVDRLFRSNIGWWKIRADTLRRAREQSKQPW